VAAEVLVICGFIVPDFYVKAVLFGFQALSLEKKTVE